MNTIIKQIALSTLAVLTLGLGLVSCKNNQHSTSKVESFQKNLPVDFSKVKIEDSFWSPRLKKHVTTTLPVCIDLIQNKTARIRNFENAAKGKGEHSGIFYDDSDVYKALEGISYSLINNPDTAFENTADAWIAKFAAAQQPDGYLNTFFTLKGLDKRWTNMDKHEMYCAGHMMEAAVAYYRATGKRTLLDVAIRMANHMMSVFGPGKRNWVPGHEEIELALVKLYEVTNDTKYLNFADWLLQERGHGYGSYGDSSVWNAAYHQDNVPVKDMTSIGGHAVRAMYLYCGMSDVAAYKEDSSYLPALDRVWDDVVLRNMYITGGIGSSKDNEGFTEDYDLPNKEAYCETCASVGMVFWNQRMNSLKGDGKYVDVLERSMYNGAIAGISLSGDHFFYVNPLESDGTHHRKPWYGTACCPSQISRFIPSIGNYIYATSNSALWVNLYISSETSVTMNGSSVSIKQSSNYPWDGDVKLTVTPNKEQPFELKLHLPAWCKKYTLKVNGKAVEFTTDQEYLTINRNWKQNDIVDFSMDMPVEVIAADPHVKNDIGKRALQRGPLVYCMEEVDNKDIDSATLSESTTYSSPFESNLLEGVVAIYATDHGKTHKFIPYYAWDNREAGKMKVWIDYK